MTTNDSELPYWIKIEQILFENKRPVEDSIKSSSSQDKDHDISYWFDIERFIIGEKLI